MTQKTKGKHLIYFNIIISLQLQFACVYILMYFIVISVTFCYCKFSLNFDRMKRQAFTLFNSLKYEVLAVGAAVS